MNDLREEADQLIGRVRAFKKRFRGRGRKWGKLRGDAYVRMVEHYLRKHLPQDVKPVRY